MFGVGPQEVLIIVVLLVVVFGPGKAVGMARDLGRFASGARNQVEEFKDELLAPPEDGTDDPDDEDEARGRGRERPGQR